MAGKYDVAQICLNGHIVTTTAVWEPHTRPEFCRDCGQRTIVKCNACHRQIQGAYWVADMYPYPIKVVIRAPGFCHGCGVAYPWTQAKFQAARDLAMELEGLEPQERERMAASFPDLIADTPQTPVAATRVRRMFEKIGQGANDVLGKLVVDLATEAAKKIIFPAM
jgi:hypothetical protein